MKHDENAENLKQRFSRRNILAMSAAFVSSIGLSPAAAALADVQHKESNGRHQLVEPFYGIHQAGIDTAQQKHTYFAALDLVTLQRQDVIALLKAWTDAAERMSQGAEVQPVPDAYYGDQLVHDSGEAIGLRPERLTITIGFGPGLFMKDGHDHFGLAHQRPEAFVDLPHFSGDQLIPERTGGDILIQACADDPQVAFHAVRQLIRLARKDTELRWVQTGFHSIAPDGKTPRNLQGFKDGTQTPSDLVKDIWVGSEGPQWMAQGSYVVVRRVRMALEHWDQMNVGFQEQVIGRSKLTGAPLGGKHEFDQLPLDKNDKDGNPVIADNAHVRLANASTNNGAQMLRRGYSYNEGVSFVAERWPPWRQAMEYDAGLMFVCYQRDPRTSFIPMFARMSKLDMLNQFTTHTGGGMFAVAGGVQRGEYLAQRLFE